MHFRKTKVDPINTIFHEPYVKINLCQEESVEEFKEKQETHHASTERRDSMVIFESTES